MYGSVWWLDNNGTVMSSIITQVKSHQRTLQPQQAGTVMSSIITQVKSHRRTLQPQQAISVLYI